MGLIHTLPALNRSHLFNAVILGAAPNSEGGEMPPALLSASPNNNVISWIVDALTVSGISSVTFVGGYKISEISQKFPNLHYLYNANWQASGVLESLSLAVDKFDRPCLISYSDIVFRKEVVDSVLANSVDDIVLAYTNNTASHKNNKNRIILEDHQLVDIGFLNAESTELAEFCGLMSLQGQGLEFARKFFNGYYLKHYSCPFEQSENIQSAYLTDFIRYAKKCGLSVGLVNATDDWAEVNDKGALVKFVLGTKAETLSRLKSVLTCATVPLPFFFSYQEWLSDKNSVLNQIENLFGCKNLAIRSSSQLEDSWQSSCAGQFCSLLNISAVNNNALAIAIDTVFSSYEEHEQAGTNQVLVQEMVADVMMSGVLFTKTLAEGADYYVINYQFGSNTDEVTSGRSNDIELTHVKRDCVNYVDNFEIKKLLNCVEEIEQLLACDTLDIEFAIDVNANVHILQVRPITTISKLEFQDELTAAIDREFNVIVSTINKLTTGNKATVLSNMADWNPAEMIGANTSNLASSLYHDLITSSTWAEARALLGYTDLSGQALMKVIADRPYIDLRNSFSSFIPACISEKKADKLVEHWLSVVSNSKFLHDKVEFEVAITCWHFNLDEQLNQLNEPEFLADELKDLAAGYKLHTREMLADYADLSTKLQKNLDVLAEKRAQLLCKPAGNGQRTELICDLIESCKRHGVLPFSVYARWAFVATTILRSIVAKGWLTEQQLEAFFNSISTVSTEFIEQQAMLVNGDISLTEFLDNFGHLRAGSYNILAKRYDEQPELFTYSSAVLAKKTLPFILSDTQKNTLNKMFLRELNVNFDEFLSFSRDVISQREQVKFEFTKNLSEALKQIELWGNENKIVRADLPYLSIEDFKLLLYQPSNTIADTNELIERRKSKSRRYKKLILPDVICNQADLYWVREIEAKPNFVSEHIIQSQVVECTENTAPQELDGKIVLIENADPGYDWIFARDIKGLITKYGGAASHMTIRAAEFGVPAAIGCGAKIYSKVQRATSITLDCMGKNIKVA